MRKVLRGVVSSARMAKSLRVEIERKYRHTKYDKIVRGRTVVYAHDEEQQAKEGDVVEIEECRPMSRLKRWRLVQVVSSATQ